MENHWSTEYGRLVLVIIALLIVSYVTGLWTVSAYVFFISFIFWQFHQLRRLEQWIAGDYKTDEALDNSGVWERLVQHLSRQHRSRKKEKKRLTNIINRNNAMASVLPYGVIVLNQFNDIMWSNPAAKLRLGIRKQDRGQNVSNYIRAPEFQEYIRKGEDQAKLKMPSPVDEKKVLIITNVNFGKKQRLLIARDVTHRVELQRSRKLFVANASHELKTPLCVVSGYLEILNATEDLPEDIKTAVGNALAQAERMRSIIEDLLLLSVLENKALNKEHCEIIDVDDKLREFVQSLHDSGELDQHQVEINSNPNLMVKAVDVEFNGIYMNLLSNAIKHTPAGTKIKVSWALSEDSNHACFIVEDDGGGIKPEYLVHITERFYRADAHQEVKGTGLGLSIVKHVLDRYGGYLDVKSELGKGSTFTACFPKEIIHLA